MPTAVKKGRKAQGAGRSKNAAPQQSHLPSSINSFTRVSKSIGNSDLKKASTPTSQKNIRLEAITPDSRKRKAAAPSEDGDSSADETPTKPILSRTTSKKIATPSPTKRGRGRPSKKVRSDPTPAVAPAPVPAPAPRKRARSPSVSDSEKSTVDTGALFKRLRIESSPSCCPSSPATADTSIAGSDDEAAHYHAKINTAKPGQQQRQQLLLPDDLLSLIDLHAAFLKTLTLHYAHVGTNVPADLRILCPNVARAWGKKKVTDADVRVCLGVLNSSASSSSSATTTRNLFSLSNYGRGKICVEIDPSHGSGPLNEKKLNALFYDNLTSLWIQHRARNSHPTAAIATATGTFMKALPKAPITLCDSVAKASPVLAKGQRRLEELKHGITLKQEAAASTKTNVLGKATTTTSTPIAQNNKKTDEVPMTNADGSKMSLLDRIRYKSLQKSLSSNGNNNGNLTPAQLARRAALQRCPDVAAVVGMLTHASSSGESRMSFTMNTLLEKLRDSLRSGISRDEGAACVRLLAKEVAPEWVRVVVLAGRGENVVVEAERQLGRGEVERRVNEVLGRL